MDDCATGDAGPGRDSDVPPAAHRFVQYVAVQRPPPTESAAEARERLRDLFPRTALRRMTHLGMLVGASLKDVPLRPEDAMVYASSYAETRAMEDFLSSFPTASPLLFQTSIHPGSVQQVLIGRQQPVARLWPLAGRSRIIEQALTIALLESAPRVIVAGGEERGTWLLQQGAASGDAFAFALVLSPERSGAVGEVWLHRGSQPGPAAENTVSPGQTSAPTGNAASPTLLEFVAALSERRPLEWSGIAGRWSLAWTA